MDHHLVSFLPLAPAIRFWDCKGGLSELALEGEASVVFSAEKYCMGYNDGEKMHKCPVHMEGSKQCAACAARDISRVYTRLDYSGFERFYEKFKNQAFSVYLVSFGHIVKCGVTRTPRLLERVAEQGADYYCELAKAEDAETAYSIETLVQGNFAVRNGLTSAQKMKLIGAAALPGRLEDTLGKVRESGILEGFEGEMKVRTLEYAVPASFSPADNIEGEICGNKGQILFFEKEGQHYGVNMSKKSGTKFDYSSRTGS
ncbi:Uncharacterised protein [uncultured archaeon]|nr:Uncharacterised protein [uncultured archaeon]